LTSFEAIELMATMAWQIRLGFMTRGVRLSFRSGLTISRIPNLIFWDKYKIAFEMPSIKKSDHLLLLKT
jgi:hypothetical protein